MKERDIDVMLLGETFLKPHASLKIENYLTYRRDIKTKQGGGTAVLIKRNITRTPLQDLGTENIEITGIQIHTNHGPLNIFAAHLPPNATLLETDLQKIYQG